MTELRASVTRLQPRLRWEYALVPEGEYEARVIDNETRLYWRGKSPKLLVWWMLLEPEHVGTVLPAFYAVPGLSGKPRRNGGFLMVGQCSRLYRDIAAMLGRRPKKIDRRTFPRDLVANTNYSVRVTTVTNDFEQEDIPQGARYSRVERVLEEAR